MMYKYNCFRGIVRKVPRMEYSWLLLTQANFQPYIQIYMLGSLSLNYMFHILLDKQHILKIISNFPSCSLYMRLY